MALDEYRLSAELLGHSLDVRSVAIASNYIVSGSRDKTAKVWQQHGGSYIDQFTLTSHTNFVSSVCLLDNGSYICTGSNDSTICVYAYGTVEPVTVLKGHAGTVSCLAAGAANGLLLSASWDKTAIVWQVSGAESLALRTLKGHEAAVWAVSTFPNGHIVTGSADKTIIYWNEHGEKLKVLKGHTDCVRSLVALPNGGLVSAGNDAVIKVWDEDGECIKELYGHTNYIYSIALNGGCDGLVIVSGGEDSTVRMWNFSGPMGDAIAVPAQSVWCVACNPANGDIVAACSDGIARIFTKDKGRYASDDMLAAYQAAVDIRTREADATLGGLKVNELPGPEALLQKGRSEGQTKMIRFPDGRIVCHEWSGGKWTAIGDVVGAAGGSQASSGKQLFEGKEYDFVFSVDIADGMPSIKLPYNRGEDPWMVAQQFIHKHELPQTYLQEVAEFIMKSSGEAPALTSSTSSSYQDPFTGGGRYIPGAGGDFASDAGNVDPFTGGSSYSTSSTPTVPVHFVPRSGQNLDPLTGGSSHTSGGAAPRRKHFPQSDYTTIDSCDAAKVLAKLKQFNSEVDDTVKVTDAELEQAVKLAQGDYLSKDGAEALKKTFRWPKQQLFPVLDVLRMAVRDGNACTQLVTPETLNLVVQNVGSEMLGNQLMSLRCLSNMLAHVLGRDLIDTFLPNVLVAISTTKGGSANLQTAIATLLLNLTIVQLTKADKTQCLQIAETIIDFLLWSNDPEALYRCYAAFGNLLSTPHQQEIAAQIVSTDQIMDGLRTQAFASKAGAERIAEVANDIINAL